MVAMLFPNFRIGIDFANGIQRDRKIGRLNSIGFELVYYSSPHISAASGESVPSHLINQSRKEVRYVDYHPLREPGRVC
jgi:hypothetical protein